VLPIRAEEFKPQPLPGCGWPLNLETADVHPSHFAALKASLFYISQTCYVSETNENPVQLQAVPVAHWLFVSLAVFIIPHKTEGSEDASNLHPFIRYKTGLRDQYAAVWACVWVYFANFLSKCWIVTKLGMNITPLRIINLWVE
jgi:hypothetical protein